jgi:hypothetical protein
LQLIDQRTRKIRDVDWRHRERDLAGFGARQRKDLVDESLQPVDLFQLTCKYLRVTPTVAEIELELAAQNRQRRAELVCQRRAELPHFGNRRVETIERAVECDHHAIELVVGITNRKPRAETAHIDRARRVGHACER